MVKKKSEGDAASFNDVHRTAINKRQHETSQNYEPEYSTRKNKTIVRAA
jgi:hypothetical protein